MIDSSKEASKIRVALVEDNAETCRTWAALLDAHPKVQCVATCATAEAALQRIPECQPQVILMDINLEFVPKLPVFEKLNIPACRGGTDLWIGRWKSPRNRLHPYFGSSYEDTSSPVSSIDG